MTETKLQNNADLDERNIAATDLKAAEDKIQSLCVTHAGTFVAVERRGAALTASLKNLLSALDVASPRIEEAKENLEMDNGNDGNESSSGGNSMAILAEKHRMRRRTLLQHSSLLELLELPSLMDACVRGQLYEEGLSIASFANTLERKHLKLSASSSGSSGSAEKKQHDDDAQKDNPIVGNIVKEVRKREADLRRHLLHRLRSDVTMPQCLEIVTALRRLNGVEIERSSRESATTGLNALDLEKVHEAMEWRLQVNFLEARDVWLEGNTVSSNHSSLVGLVAQNNRKQLSKRLAMPSGNTEQLLDSIDVYRTRCFEIATQFLAIFRSSTSGSLKFTATNDKASQLLSMWTTRRIDTFLHQKLSTKYLPLITDTSSLRDVLDSVTFFATSMGRIGSNFSPLLPSIFTPCLLSIVTTHWNNGLNTFQDTLKVCRDAGIASPLYNSREVISPIGTNVDEGTDTIGNGGSSAKTPSPPRQLLSLPPLARLVNAFLTGLNELRRCSLASSFPKLRLHFREAFLKKATMILNENERAVLKPGFLSKGEEAGKLRSVAVEMKEEFEGCVEPYLTSALEVSLGSYEVILAKETFVTTETMNNNDDAHVEDEKERELEDMILEEKTNDNTNADEDISVGDDTTGAELDTIQESMTPVDTHEEAELHVVEDKGNVASFES
mmetsp:Transcript_13099/g.14732  ORF Transcript_13099/g.14732 Transcript_13099/m.14732 type:complete len:671 (-) Transcript_13099:192-2204(-)